jgi:hypothetical protein
VDEPLKWRTKVEIPVTNDTFYLGKEMPGMLKNLKTENIAILLAGISKTQPGQMYDTTAPEKFLLDTMRGDTVVFSILRKDSISYDTYEDSMETKYFHPRVGPITITGAAPVSSSVPLPAVPGSVDIPIPKVYSVTFDPTSPDLSVTVTNNSATGIAGGSITILGTTRAMQNPLGAGASQTLTFPSAGQTVPGTLRVSISGTSAADAGKLLGLSFNFNGLIASSIRCMDSLVNFQQTYTNDYSLTDTLDVDYIDMREGAFVYSFQNTSSIPLEVKAEQLHLWNISMMSANNITTFEQIALKPGISEDSAKGNLYWGDLTQGFKEVKVDSTQKFLGANLAQCRLFPVWNDTILNDNGTRGKSVSRVTYTVRTKVPTGATISMNAADSMLFIIKAPGFVFREMSGTVVRAYEREGDTAKIEVPFPFNKGSKDSLKGNFFLKHVEADIYMTPNLPDSTGDTPRRAQMSTLGVRYTLFNPDSPNVKNADSTVFSNVYNNKLFRHRLKMDTILNQWPDSMFIMVKINIPVGTRLLAVNDLYAGDPDWGKYMGRMKIKAVNTVRMNAVLDWEVRDTAHLDLGAGKFAIGKSYKIANKLQDKSFKFFMNARNHTNAFMNIYALAAPDSVMMKKLDNLSVDSTWSLIRNPAQAAAQGFISLLGNRGVRIPARGRVDTSGVDLNEADLQKILTSDTCSFRWQARFIPYTPVRSDALIDEDYIDIRSYATVQGTNSMDSLLIWEKDTTD